MTFALYICWGLVIAAWIAGAAYNAKHAPRTERGASRILDSWTWWLVPGVCAWALNHYIPASAWTAITLRSPVLSYAGLALLAASTWLTLWARWTLGTMWSSVPTRKESHELRTTGAYGVTRHPIYSGLLGMLTGSMMMSGFGPTVIFVVIFGTLFLFRIPREERLMTEAFGDQYETYRRRVPALVPFARF
jgi:protein-S-isoprenylcysteine O-methyltransferase Ste14